MNRRPARYLLFLPSAILLGFAVDLVVDVSYWCPPLGCAARSTGPTCQVAELCPVGWAVPLLIVFGGLALLAGAIAFRNLKVAPLP